MKNILNSPVIYLTRKMYFYSRERRKYIIGVTLCFIIAGTIESSKPLIFGYLLNSIQQNGVNKENIIFLCFILFLLFLAEFLFWVFWGPARISEQKTAFIAKKNYKEYLLQGSMGLPLAWHADHHSGDTIDKIDKGTNALFSFSEQTFMFVSAIVRIVVSFFALFFISVNAGILACITSIIIFYIMFLYDKRLVPGYKIVNSAENKISEKIYDAMSNITTVIVLRIESLVFKSISRAIDRPYAQFRKNSINNEWKWFYAAALGQLTMILVLVIYLIGVVNKNEVILVGSISVLFMYTSRVRETFFNFAQMYNNAVKWKTNIMNAEELTKEFSSQNIITNQKNLPKNWSTISINDLSFSYHDETNADLHLDDVNVDFKKGEKIAVIGESGGGKTTFLNLFRGLYVPRSISLKIDTDKSVPDFNSISDSISLIPQDPEIFSTTIRENITLGVDYPLKEIRSFTDLASFSDIVDRLPNGLESTIVEKGVNLSGGEKQRLALARGLLASKDKDIVLLDEPTSSVDFHNELNIYENIFKRFPEKTIISSIHRLHLLPLFDTILFFKDGKIVSRGNLEYLKENSKDFQELWEKYLQTQNQ